MLLYHFTPAKNLDSIKAIGITRGEVAVSPTDRRQDFAVWLTDGNMEKTTPLRRRRLRSEPHGPS
jgi:hypothetical protein